MNWQVEIEAFDNGISKSTLALAWHIELLLVVNIFTKDIYFLVVSHSSGAETRFEDFLEALEFFNNKVY